MKQPNKWLTSAVDTYIKYFGHTDNPLVYEVGSRDGHDGVELANRIRKYNRLVVDENIVLIECNPPHIEAIRSTYPEATLITEAISNRKGMVEFLQIHGDKNMMGSSSMDLSRIKEPWVKQTSIIKVLTRRLDDVIEQLGHQDTDIDIMKIDIEHYSYEALESLGKYLRNVRVFHVETEIEGVARNKTNLDIALYMEQKGYLCTSLQHEWGVSIQDQVYYRQ